MHATSFSCKSVPLLVNLKETLIDESEKSTLIFVKKCMEAIAPTCEKWGLLTVSSN
jgi:hypothetical protein